MPLKLIHTLIICFCVALYSNGQITYVKPAATGTGSSWANASGDLMATLNNASSGDTIWVAAGTYKPTTGANRNISFEIPDSVKVFGGFAGNEASNYDLDLRDFTANETILSGNINSGSSLDNSYNVIYTAGVSSATHVNGFTISDGYAADMNGERQRRGGGWYNDGTTAGASSPTISHCIFKSNIAQYGGGMYNNAGSSGGETKPLLWHCTFISNFAFRNDINNCDGGAIYNDGEAGDSSPILENCVFEDNYSKGTGDAIYNYVVNGKCSPVVNNCIFKNTIEFNTNNRATLVFFGNGDASAVFNNCLFTTEVNSMHISYDDGTVNKQPQFTNCTFYGASTRVIETLFDSGQTPVDFSSCIFWGNSGDIASDNAHVNITYSIVEEAAFTQDSFSGNSNINHDPLFVNAPAGNFRLNSNSPANNTGDNATVSVLRDIAGNSRIKSVTVDMGAYESPGKMYVDVSKTSAVNNNGSSWPNAYTDLQDALQSASPKDTIWVAAGTYKPTTSTDRSISFQIPDSVKVYGGFAGNEPDNYDLNLRDFTTNETILSGEIGNQNNITDNTYHVVYTKNVSSETVVDGITITNGNANGIFSNNEGGGWFNDGSGGGNSSNPALTNCTFTSNTAGNGGAMYNDGRNGESSPVFTACIFSSNTASINGGAVNNNGSDGKSSPVFTTCTFDSNTASLNGGAIFNIGFANGTSNPTLTNCTFTSNTAANSNGGAMYNSGFAGTSNPTLTNCILWDNMAGTSSNSFYNNNATVTISYSLVEEASCSTLVTNSNGGVTCSAGTMIYNQDPQFINVSNPAGADNVLGTADDGLRLQNSSPAKNAGDNGAVSVLRDIVGNSRIKSGTVDMGAYESPGKMYVDVSKTSAVNNNGSSWSNAYTDLQDALQGAGPKDTIWVAKGTYKPTTGIDRAIYFQIPDSVKVYGGFAGNEASNYDLNLRDFTANETILSGDIGTPNDNMDNTIHVVFTQNVSSETEVDGVTITGGNANAAPFPNDSGGGWFNDGSGNSSNPTMANCTFVSNTAGFGGAMSNYGSSGESSPVFTTCIFSSNTASINGGAVHNNGFDGKSSPVFTTCTFTSNTANNDGGAMYNLGVFGTSNPTLTNCTFTSNTSSRGGAMYNYGDFGGDSNPTLTNCTFTSNMANDDGGAMYNFGLEGTSNPTLTNCILWGNMEGTTPNSFYNRDATVNISFSLVEGASCGDGSNGGVSCGAGMIYNQDPLFVNASDPAGVDNVLGTADDGLRLQNSSPAIDQGSNAGITHIEDITGQKHINAPDMGAYENPCSKFQTITSVAAITGSFSSSVAVLTLQANNIINPTSNVYYQAGNSILLQPGFEAKSGNVFEAEIGNGCL